MSASSCRAAVVVTLLGALLTAPIGRVYAAAQVPLITLVYPAPYGSIFDRTCTARLGVPVEKIWVEETLRRRDEFQRSWDREGTRYLAATLRAVGAPFPYAEMQATLTVCTDVSLAMPLMVNTRSFLSDAPAPEDIVMFPRLVFHELMHTYTEPVNGVSALQQKYAAEGLHVTLHLHVLALEKFVLTKLGRQRELALLDHDYRELAPPAYRRAWQIVDTEGVAPFLEELRRHLPRQTAAQAARTR